MCADGLFAWRGEQCRCVYRLNTLFLRTGKSSYIVTECVVFNLDYWHICKIKVKSMSFQTTAALVYEKIFFLIFSFGENQYEVFSQM